MKSLSKTSSSLIKAGIITAILDIISKFGFYSRIETEKEMGLNTIKILLLVYIIIGVVITSNLFKFKKWAFLSYLIYWLLTIGLYWYTNLTQLSSSGIIGSIIGFNFLSIFSIIVLLINRNYFVK